MDTFEIISKLSPAFGVSGEERQAADAALELLSPYGEGAFEKRMAAFAQYREMGLTFGASVLVTKENAEEAADPAFVKKLADCGCRMLFFREEASFTAEDREAFTARINAVRSAAAKPLIISFPQDMLDAYGLTELDQDRFSVDVHGRCILLQK